MEAHAHRLGLLGAEHFLHHLGVGPANRPELGDLFEEVGLRDKEEREPGRKLVHVETSACHVLHEGLCISQGKSYFVQRATPGFRDVIAADVDWVIAAHVASTIHDSVAHDTHARADRVDPLLLGRVLLKDIVLNGARELVKVVSTLFCQRHVHREQDPGARIYGHGDAGLFQVYAVKQRLHVVEYIDRHAFAADLPPAHTVVGVIAHQGRHVEVYRQAGLPLAGQVLQTFVGFGPGSETGDLAHGPRTSPVHGRVRAPGERIASGEPDLFPRRVGDVRRRVDALYRQPRAAEILRPPLRHAFHKAGQFVAFPVGHLVLYLPGDALLDQAGKLFAVKPGVWAFHVSPFGSSRYTLLSSRSS